MKVNFFSFKKATSFNYVASRLLLLFCVIFITSCDKRTPPPAPPAPAYGNSDFVSVWNVTNGKISLPLVSNGTYDFVVDWGDGKKDYIKSWDDPKKTHSYATNKQYTVTITGGKIIGWAFVYDTGKRKPLSNDNESFIEVKNWGRLSLGNTTTQFAGCKDLRISAKDAPDLSTTNSLAYAFFEATNFNSNINHWDVSRITNMGGTFAYAKAFNQPLDKWNVSNVTNMGYMFDNALRFDQNINNWNVSRVTFMGVMFYGAETYNQPLNNWNVSNVKDMSQMFYAAKSFNQDISSWDVRSITNSVYHAEFSPYSPLIEPHKPKFK